MKRIVFVFSLVCLSFASHAKTVADFINEYPELATSPTVKAAIQSRAIGNAGLDAVSNGATGSSLGEDVKKLMAANGYQYAQAALRDLATSDCGENRQADVYGFREKECQAMIKVDAKIE